MAVDPSQIATDLGNVILDLTTVAQFAGITVGGVFSDLTVGKTLEDGGFMSDFDASFIARQSSFSTLPASGNTLGVGGVSYRVKEIVKDPSGAGVEIHLLSPDK